MSIFRSNLLVVTIGLLAWLGVPISIHADSVIYRNTQVDLPEGWRVELPEGYLLASPKNGGIILEVYEFETEVPTNPRSLLNLIRSREETTNVKLDHWRSIEQHGHAGVAFSGRATIRSKANVLFYGVSLDGMGKNIVFALILGRQEIMRRDPKLIAQILESIHSADDSSKNL